MFTILTGDKQLNTFKFDFRLTCTSTSSQTQYSSAVHDFSINFRDECLDTVISPAVNDDVEIPLGEFFYEGLLQ